MTTTTTAQAEALRDLDNAAVALCFRAAALTDLARDYVTNESTRNSARHNGTMWVQTGRVIQADIDAVLRDADALAVACRDQQTFGQDSCYAVALGAAARAARAGLDALLAYPVKG